MKKIKKIISCIILCLVIFHSGQTFANVELDEILGKLEYTQEFKSWLELPEEEKYKTKMPRSYNIPNITYEYTNPIKIAHTVGSATLSKYTLRDYIPENLVIRNQMETNSCWAFASLGMLESHLGLQDYINNKDVTVYDFSERHMQYATIREFNNGEINIWGGNRKTTEGGNVFRSRPYLANGIGPVNETEMPFENNEDMIDLKEIQGKTVSAQLYDTIDFPTIKNGAYTTEMINQIKEHIRENGGIEAGIHGADLESEYYNKDTAAIYCNDAKKGPTNHDVVIIGWDDEYAIENFNETCRPQNRGAWIIKNSWGKEEVIKFSEVKKMVFAEHEENCIQNGWNSPEEIPDSFINKMFEDSEFIVRDDELALEIGDEGFMYVSYEDVNIYESLIGIEKATSTVNYDKIYQYDELGAPVALPLTTQRVYVANIFDRNENTTEYLSEVSMFFAEPTTAKLYVNPNGNSLANQDLIKVELKDGNFENVTAGYHTLELKEPLNLTSDKFAVVLELEGKQPEGYSVPMEIILENTPWSTAKLENDKSFWTIDGVFEENVWASLSDTEDMSNGELPNGDFTIKAFTISELPKGKIESIEIAAPPNKIEYTEGQDFDKTGMKVNVVYENGSKEEITDYTIENGTNLKVDQKVIIIKYGDKVVTQDIKVKANNVKDEEIDNPETTDFSKAEAIANNIKAYYFTNKNNKEYITMSILLDKIARKENDNYKYYYYLSSNSSEENIKNWVEIKEKQNFKSKLEFLVDTKEISNYNEISKSDKLYIYVKEIVKKGELQKEYITKAILLQKSGEIEVYKDNVKQEQNNDKKDENNSDNNNNNSNNNNNNNNNNNSENKKDDTTSPTKLPAAGLKLGVIILIIVISIFGLRKYIQYKYMNF